MANISANRISKKSAESGVHNHDGSVPYIKHALGYEMDRWRVENGFYGLETGGAGARPPACTASLGTLEVVASGSQPIAYQWHRGDVPVEGANAFRYEVASAKPEHTGEYKLVMFNEAGEVVSDFSSVVVYEPVNFIELPSQVQVFPGDTATFNVSTTGTEPITYQWLRKPAPE